MRNRAAEILKLNDELIGATESNLQRALRIGELLTEQKAELQHGEWMRWLEQNVVGPRLSRSNVGKFMKLWTDRDRLKLLETSNLTDALRLAYTPRKKQETVPLDEDDIAELYPTELCFDERQEAEFDELKQKLGEVFQTESPENIVLRALRSVNYHEGTRQNEPRTWKEIAAIRLGPSEWQKVLERAAFYAETDD